MKPGLFGQALPRLGLLNSKNLASKDYWQLWEATEERTFGDPQLIQILYFDSRANWTTVEQAVRQIKGKTSARPQNYYAVCQNSAVMAKDLSRLQKATGGSSAFTVRQLLTRTIGQRLGATQAPDDEADRIFVPPDLQRVTPDLTPSVGPDVEKAIPTLSQWLMDDSGPGSRVAVLVAKAGIGKTTVARQLFRHLRGKDGAGRFPILVETDQWAKLSDRASLSLWDVWRESLDALYGSALSRDDFEIAVENGLFLPVFDGFDELCTRLGAHFLTGDTVTQLLQLVEDTEGRILITTRDAFWLDNLAASRRQEILHFQLLPFNKQQTTKYFENRFRTPKDFGKRTVASNILQRIAQVAHAEEIPEPRQRLTAVPLIVTLAGECADIEASEASVLKYGKLLSSEDPLRGLLLILFERERERRKLALTPEQQLGLFSDLAFNCGDLFSAEQLRLFAAVHGITDAGAQTQALQSHVLVKLVGKDYAFRFDFLGRYLAAGALVQHLLEAPTGVKVQTFLDSESRGGTVLIDRAVDYLFAHHRSDALDRLAQCWQEGRRKISKPAQSGLLHIIMKSVERELSSVPRSERTLMLGKVLGITTPRCLSELYLEGTITGLDFRGVAISGCTFVNAGFAKCQFDRSTRFVDSTFEGAFDVEDCDDFGDATYDHCNFGPRAREVVQLNDPTGRLPVTPDQVRATVRLALQAFQKGVAFKAIPRTSCKRGRISTSPICDKIWDALEQGGVVVKISIKGLLENGLQIAEDRREEVQLFLSNAILSGVLRDTVDKLVRSITPKGVSAAD